MASTFVPSLATSPRPSDQEIARAQAVARRREELAKEREAFVSDFVKSKRADIQASATANEYLDVDGPGRRGVVRVGTPAAPVIDEDGLRTQALSAWKGEVARRIGESQRAEMSKIRSFLDARMKLMPGEPPEAFEMRKFAASQELGKRRGIPVEPAPNDVVGTVGYIGEVGRSLARGVTGVTKSLTSDLPVLAGTIGERMGFLGSSNLVAGGRAVGEAIESVVPEAGIQPSMAAQGAGMLDPRFYASRLPETAVQLGATMAPGIGIAGAAGGPGRSVSVPPPGSEPHWKPPTHLTRGTSHTSSRGCRIRKPGGSRPPRRCFMPRCRPCSNPSPPGSSSPSRPACGVGCLA